MLLRFMFGKDCRIDLCFLRASVSSGNKVDAAMGTYSFDAAVYLSTMPVIHHVSVLLILISTMYSIHFGIPLTL